MFCSRRIKGLLSVLVFASALPWPSAASGPAEIRLPAPGTSGWKELPLPGGKKMTRYRAVRDGVATVLRAEANCSASAIYYPFDSSRWARMPRLSWRWRIAAALPPHSEREKSGDDFAARVYVMFAFDPKRASWWERLRHQAGKALAGGMLPGSAINYVWTTGEGRGQVWKNPYAAESRMVSLGKGPLGGWRREEVDVLADYRRLFGHNPTRLLGVAVMTDADDTCGHALAYYADVVFRARP